MSESTSLRALLAVLFRHKKKALAASLLVFSGVLAVTAFMQPRFRSQAMLFVRLGRENVSLDPTVSLGGGSVVAVPQAREDEINSVVEILKSRSLLERIVDQLGPETILGQPYTPASASTTASYVPIATLDMGGLETYLSRLLPGPPIAPRDKALERLARQLRVSAPKRTTVVHVAYDGPSPAVAQRVVNQLIEQYMEEHVRLNRTAGSHDFFVEQTGQIRHQLLNAEKQLRDVKNQTGMASVEDQRKILVDRIGRLEDDLLRNSAELASLNAELASLNTKLDRLPETRVTQRVSGLPNQAADLMRQQLYTLQLKEQELLSTFKEDARQVQELRRQIQEAQAILAKEEYERSQSTNSADPTFQQLHLSLHSKQAQAASLQVRIEKAREQLDQAKAEIERLNDNEMRIVQLRRDLEVQEANYLKYAENLEQARIDQALKLERISNIGVAQPASLEPRQVRPQVLLQVAGGLLASVLAGIAVAFAAESLDQSLKSASDIEQQLELTSVASIPRLSRKKLGGAAKPQKHAHARPR